MATTGDVGNEKKVDYERMFLDKLTLLNRAFLKFVEQCVMEMPDADLSSTVRDYLKHVKSLDEMYGSESGAGSVQKRPIKIAKRMRKCHSNEQKRTSETKQMEKSREILPTEKVTETLPAPAPPKIPFAFGGTSSSASFASKEENNERRGRKRANRGGQEGGDDMVIIQGGKENNSSKVATSGRIDVPVFGKVGTATLSSDAKVTADKINVSSDSKPILSTNISATKPPLFTFGSSSVKKSGTEDGDKLQSSTDVPKVPPSFSFGASSNAGTTASFGFGKSDKEKREPPVAANSAVPLFSIGKSKDSNSKSSTESPKLTSSSTASSDIGSTPKLTFTFSGGQSLFSDSNSVNPLSSLSGFKFGPPAGATTDSDSTTAEEKEEEYVPPQPEAVLQEEPDAVLSTKCSVFALKGKEYEKIGIGQFHIKEGSDNGKKIMLIRAATTIAAVWVNSFIDKNMKCAKIDDTKLRVSCVNGTTPSTYLIRFPNSKTREQVEENLKC